VYSVNFPRNICFYREEKVERWKECIVVTKISESLASFQGTTECDVLPALEVLGI
jgi:hypothetical protein